MAEVNPSSRLVPKAHVRAYPMGDEVVLFDPTRDEALTLSAAGRAVWEACADAPDRAALIERLCSRHGIDAETARAAVQNAAEMLLTRGLLFADPPTSPPPPDDRIVYPTFEGDQVAVHADDPAIAASVRGRFRAMLGDGGGRTVAILRAVEEAGRYHVSGARALPVECGTAAEAIRSLKHEVVLRFVEARPDLLWLHAGAATRNGGALLLVGAWGSGKSTLTADLCRRGWQYLSDDVIPFDPGSGHVYPFPLTLAYRRTQGTVLEREAIPSLPKVEVALSGLQIAPGPVPVWGIAFPSFVPGAQGHPEPCSPATAVATMLNHVQNATAHVGDAVEALCRLADGAPAYNVAHGTPGAAAKLTDMFTGAPGKSQGHAL